jgi:hypothetical protein
MKKYSQNFAAKERKKRSGFNKKVLMQTARKSDLAIKAMKKNDRF